MADRDAVIAVLPVVGRLEFSTVQPMLQALREQHTRRRIGVLVLQINCTGGSVAAAQDLCEAIDALRAGGTRVLAQCADVAKSAALYLAVAADRVYAQPSTLTGHVGAITRHWSIDRLAERLGIHDIVVASGPFKDPAQQARCPDPAEQAVLEALIHELAGHFLDWLQQRRQLSPDTLRELASGRVISGTEALRLGLVDELGGSWRALTAAADHLGQAVPRIVQLGAALGEAPPWYLKLLPKSLRELATLLTRSY